MDRKLAKVCVTSEYVFYADDDDMKTDAQIALYNDLANAFKSGNLFDYITVEDAPEATEDMISSWLFDEDEDDDIADRLDYLRGEIEAERISYDEISELQSLAEHIDRDDVVLRQWAECDEDDD
jgi:hypothetical protein